MKIGIMGGTFDPIHNGHLMIAKTAYSQYHLDEIWFMPNGNPPHKEKSNIGSDVEKRVEMVRLAIEGYRDFQIELYEALKKTISYSYETMEHFVKLYPEHEFFFIIGADSLFSIEKWVHPERLFATCTILAAYRDEIDTREEMYTQINYLKKKYNARIELIISPLVKISSSEIRAYCIEKKDISGLVPEKVKEYIRKEGLYESENQ
ncbi:MAG: nicotinate-nucleotide adenylyltransferase [Lachnospiraceae bacterium]